MELYRQLLVRGGMKPDEASSIAEQVRSYFTQPIPKTGKSIEDEFFVNADQVSVDQLSDIL